MPAETNCSASNSNPSSATNSEGRFDCAGELVILFCVSAHRSLTAPSPPVLYCTRPSCRSTRAALSGSPPVCEPWLCTGPALHAPNLASALRPSRHLPGTHPAANPILACVPPTTICCSSDLPPVCVLQQGACLRLLKGQQPQHVLFQGPAVQEEPARRDLVSIHTSFRSSVVANAATAAGSIHSSGPGRRWMGEQAQAQCSAGTSGCLCIAGALHRLLY